MPSAMHTEAKIYVAGHAGLVGSALCRALKRKGYINLVTRTHTALDLCNQADVQAFFADERPEIVILAAAKVGGIHANATYPAEFIQQNLLIQTNVIDSAYHHGCRKLLFLGSSCIYPKLCPQPMTEESLLTGSLEPTNEPYALAKIAGIKMCQAYRRQYNFDAISAMPTNLYGPGDNYHPENSHVIPGLIRKFHEAKQASAPSVTIWGTGTALREFLYVDDMADACVFLLENYSGLSHINVGSGKECTILELAHRIARIIGYTGAIYTDPSKPDGTPRKLMDSSRLFAMGWQPRKDFDDGLRETYAAYLHES